MIVFSTLEYQIQNKKTLNCLNFQFFMAACLILDALCIDPITVAHHENNFCFQAILNFSNRVLYFESESTQNSNYIISKFEY